MNCNCLQTPMSDELWQLIIVWKYKQTEGLIYFLIG